MANPIKVDLKDLGTEAKGYLYLAAGTTEVATYGASVPENATQIATVTYGGSTQNASVASISFGTTAVVSVGASAATASSLSSANISGGAAGSVYNLTNVAANVTGSSSADTFKLDGNDTITAAGADTSNVSSVGNGIKGDASKVYFVDAEFANITADSLGTDGKVGSATAGYTLAEPSADYFTTNIGGKKYAWNRVASGVTIDLSSEKVKEGETGYTFYSKGDGKNKFVGTNGEDTFYVLSGDTVDGGKGNDSIIADGKDNVTYIFTANDGKDSVQGFQSGFGEKAGTVYIASATDASLAHSSLVVGTADGAASIHGTDNGTLTLYGTGTDNYSITLNEGTSKNFTKYKADVKLAVGSDSVKNSVKNYEFLANTYNAKAGTRNAQKLTDSVQVVYGTDTVNGEWVSLDDSTKRTAINLSTYQKDKADGDTTYANISGIDASGSTTDDVLIGSGKFNTTILGGKGADSVWGGVGSTNDSIVLDGDTVKGSTVFFGTSNGNDTVANFTDNDSIVVYDYAKPTSVTKTPSADEEKGNNITATFADGSTLVLKNVSDMTNGTIKAKAYGDTAYKFQIATDRFSATKGTDIYYATQEGSTLNITDDYDSSTLWLYDYNNVPEGKDYSKAMVNGKNTYVKINAAGRSDDLAFTGTKHDDTIVAGTGKTTMWGGSGTDVLYGNETGDGIATFYFLKGYKADTTVYSYNTLDKVVFAGGTTLSDIKSHDVKGGVLSVELTDGSKLTVNNFGTTGTSTVTLGGTDYTYDSATNKFTAKAKA